MSEIRSVDIVTHFFPPVGGPASNRLLGWARHFTASGVNVRVTAPEPHPRDPYFDATAAPPQGVDVRRVPGADLARRWRGAGRWRRFLLPWRDMLDLPDHRRVWNGLAARAIEQFRPTPQVLLTTSPYNSTHLIGLRLKRRRPELVWVADFRDVWFQQWDRRWHTQVHRAYGRRLEREVALGADLLVFFHAAGIDDMASRLGDSAVRRRALVVYNGYSEEAAVRFAAAPADLTGEPLRVAFAGTIWEWNLPPGFFPAWRAFCDGLGRRVELHLCGRIEPGPLALISEEQAAAPGSVVVHGCLPQVDSLAVMARAAVQLVFSGPYRESVSSKLFDCIAARRPILYFGAPTSAGGEILRNAGATASLCAAYDAGGVRDLLARLAAALRAGNVAEFVPAAVPPDLSSGAQAERLLTRLRTLCAAAV